jgi:hypothetical protein
MLSGYCTSMLVNGTIILPVGWLPLTAWAALGLAQAEPRRALLGQALILAAVLGASVATGNPAWFDGMVLSAALVLVTARRRLRALALFAAAALLGTALGSASLLPTLMTLRDSSRGAGFTLAEGGAWSMHPFRMLEWIWPMLFGYGLRPEQNLGELVARSGGALEAFWSGSLYVSVPVLFCAGLAVVRGGSLARRLGLLSLFFVLLALGRFTPVYGAYRFLVWPERLLRYPEKHIASALVLWSALAGLGLDRLFSARARLRTILLSALPALMLALGALVLWLAREPLIAHLSELSRTVGRGVLVPAALQASLEGGLTAAGVAALIPLLLLVARQERLGRWALPAFCLLVCGHLVGHDWSAHVTLERRLIRARPALLEATVEPSPGEWPRILRRADDVMPVTVPGELRAMLLHHTALQNDAGRFGFGQLPAYAIAGTPRFDAFAQASGAAPLERVMDLLDVRYLILPVREAAGMGMPVLSHEPLAGQVLLENPERRPRAFVAYRWRAGQSDDETFSDLFQRPRAQTDMGLIHISRPGPDQTDAPGAPTPCQIDRRQPEHVILRCRAERAGWAVLADEWVHGWTARVDGVAADVERADGLLRAVRVTAGEHTIEFHYRTPGLTLGVWIALFAWLILAALLVSFRRRDQLPAVGDNGRKPSHFSPANTSNA